jgi:hypothetical protein
VKITTLLSYGNRPPILQEIHCVSIRTYSEHSQRSIQGPKRDPSGPEGTAHTPQAADHEASHT